MLAFEPLQPILHVVHKVWSGPVLTGLGPLDWSQAAKTKDQTAGLVFGTLETAGPDRCRTRPKTGLGTGPGPDRWNSNPRCLAGNYLFPYVNIQHLDLLSYVYTISSSDNLVLCSIS
jgi:hypothetical protein